jgi:Fe-S-cluster containining protein
VTHDHLGAIFALDVKELYKLREISVQAMQLQLQQQCAWLAYQQTKVKTEDVATLIDPSAIRSGVLHDSGVSLFVSETFKPYGGSQHTTARRLGISQRTVCRALSKVEKRRIFQHRPEFCREHQEALFTDYEEGTSTASRYWRFAGRTYKALPSLYFLALELKGSRYNRRRIAASFAKGNIPRS